MPGVTFSISWSMMRLAIVLVLWWVFLQTWQSVQGIPLDVQHPEVNISKEISTMNIQITEYPGGHILLITPEELPINSSDSLLIGGVPSSIKNTEHYMENTINETLVNLQQQLREFSSKVSVLESKLERRLMHDVKNSPNIFFLPPKSPQTQQGFAVDDFKGNKKLLTDKLGWIVPLTETTTAAPELPVKNIFSRITPREYSTTTSIPQRQIDLLNRAKRKSEKNREAIDKKTKVISLCARIIPLDVVKTQTTSSGSSIRRLKRIGRDMY